MSYAGQIIDIFVSSPGDVSTHRDSIVSIVQAWNQRNGRSRKLFFNCLRWEDLVSPDIGESGQDVINEQIGEEYDIFLGVMWARFGSPTLHAKSGTEEEFDRAVNRYQSGKQIKVCFLFCTADVPISKLDGDQFSKVQSFKRKSQENGCLTRDFLDEASLINSVNLVLDRFANTWEVTDHDSDTTPEKVYLTSFGPQESDDVAARDERGLFDVLEDFSEHNSSFVNSMNEWTSRLEKVNVNAHAATAKLSDLSKFGRPEPADVLSVINDMTGTMSEFGDWSEEELSALEKIMEQLSEDSLLLMDLSRGIDEPAADIVIARDALGALVQGIDGANEGILGFADAVEQSPKLDKKLNRANRKVIETHRRLAEKNRIFKDDMLLCMNDLNERLKQRNLLPEGSADGSGYEVANKG